MPAQPPAPAGRTVLVVEDEDAVLAMLTLSLTTQGHTALGARSGAEALALAARHAGAVDLLVVDMHLPDFGGPQLVQALRPVLPAAKVLYMSGYPQATFVAAGQLTGAEPFLHKPFAVAALAQKVQEALAS